MTLQSREIIIGSPYGGLGDNIQLSTLPELFTNAGYDVYIWDQTYFRNVGIKELVWGSNPFIKGEKSGVCNAGDTPGRHRPVHPNPISNWEVLHGFSPTNLFPKVYYKPQSIKNLENTFLVDLSSISSTYDLEIVRNVCKNLSENFPGKRFCHVQFKQDLNPASDQAPAQNGTFHNLEIGIEDVIIIDNIFQYCDTISSSFGLITLHSGASHLSSALKEFNPDLLSFCIVEREKYNFWKQKSLHLYDNIQYIII